MEMFLPLQFENIQNKNNCIMICQNLYSYLLVSIWCKINILVFFSDFERLVKLSHDALQNGCGFIIHISLS